MRSIILLLLCTWCMSPSYAQNEAENFTLKSVDNCKIYFASGSYELDGTSLETIRALLKNYKADGQFEFQLQAFTDDLGSVQQNERVAKRRADAVQRYLEEEGIATALIQRKSFQQLKLDRSQGIAQQRRENRSVVVELFETKATATPVVEAPNVALNNFFVNARKSAQQTFTFDASKGQLIEGAKGTVLQIPPNAFVDSTGVVVRGKVTFILQEAYSYGDMILQNLSTMAGDDLLESGGMLYLEAKDANGAALSLSAGTEIEAAMASKEAQLEGMQTFEGQEDADGNINWVATNTPVTAVKLNDLWRTNYQNYTFYQASTIDAHKDFILNAPVKQKRMPFAKKSPVFRKKAPKAPRVRALEAVVKEAIQQKYPKQSKESSTAYRERIHKKYRSLQTIYRQHKIANRKKLYSYKRDSSNYSRKLARYDRAMEKYVDYNKKMRVVLDELYANTAGFDMAAYCEAYYGVGRFVGMLENNTAQMTVTLEYLRMVTEAYVEEGYPMEALLERLNVATLNQLSPVSCKKLIKEWTDARMSCSVSRFYKNKRINEKHLGRKMNRHSNSIARLHHRLPETDLMRPQKLQQIRNWKQKIRSQYNFRWFMRVNRKAKQFLENNQAKIAQFVAMEQQIMALQETFLEQRNELGVLEIERIENKVNELATTNNDFQNRLATIYGNSMRIGGLGWFNCDRMNFNPRAFERQVAQFDRARNRASERLRRQQERLNKRVMDLEILAESQNNTAVFIVFKGNKSVIRTTPAEKDKFLANDVFKNRQVKIIGVRIKKEGAELFIEEGMVSKLHKVKPVFKEKTMNEVERILATI